MAKYFISTDADKLHDTDIDTLAQVDTDIPSKYIVLMMNFLVFHTGEKPSDNEVKQLLDEVEKYTLASHLLWGLWGIISVYSLSNSIII